MKYYIGIDTGTTSISLAAVSENREFLASRTVNHNAFIEGAVPDSRIQNPERIKTLALEALDSLVAELGRPSGIGFTGQMHGILYVNEKGEAVSPLYTWQDKTGDSALGLLRGAGLTVSPGYGTATHTALQRSGGIPREAVKLSTISDYIAMTLCGNTEPVLSSEMAASLGCFDLRARKFHADELDSLGVDTSYLPRVVKGYAVIGETSGGVPTATSMGDNQAAVKGSLTDEANSVLVNIGTGSQVSFVSSEYVDVSGEIELRPYGEEYLLAGAALCGGRAYAMLERFYREIAGSSCYDMMARHAEEFMKSGRSAWKVDTRFAGTRSAPEIRGSISGIGEDNFTPGAFTLGMIEGIIGELYGMYEVMERLTGRRASVLVGSGNGMRKNPLMQRAAGETFGMSVEIPAFTEEAACGAALCALAVTAR